MLRSRSRPLLEPITASQLLNAVTFGAKAREGGEAGRRRVPGAQAQPLTNLPVFSIPQLRAQDPELTQKRLAPVVTVLDQLNRPVHAVAAATRANIKDLKEHGYHPFGTPEGRKAARSAAVKGFKLEDRSLFSDVLDDLGVDNPVVKGVGGFALDVALDPTTYVTAGGTSVARSAARSAARKAEKKAFESQAAKNAGIKAARQAVKRGASHKEAAAAGRAARRKHARRAGARAGEAAAAGKATNTGLDIRFGGTSIPGLTRGTSAAKRAPRAVADRAGLSGGRVDRAQQSVRDAVRSVASEVNPNITPVGVDRDAYQAMRRAARTARARTQRGDVYAALRGQSYVDRVGVENFQRVIYAIEEGTVRELPEELRAEANRFIGDMRKMLKDERRAGVKVADRTQVGDVVNYVKHLRIEEETPRYATVGGRSVNPDFAKRRGEGTIREKNAAEPGAYSEDLGQVFAQRASQSSRSTVAAKLNQAIAKTGRRLQAGGDVRDQVAKGESVYRVDGSDLVKLDITKAKDRNIIDKGRGKYVVLNDAALERTVGTVAPAGARTTPGVFFDKVQGVWKIGATVVNPGYYTRNYMGEAMNAWLKENPVRLTRNAAVAGRALREIKKREEAARRGEKYEPGKYGDLIDKAEDVGAVRAGQYAREVGQLLSKESKKNRAGKIKGAGPLRRAARVRDNIEDQFRLASFKGGLDRGLDPERAMQRASKTHFDYGDLTPTERKVLRRVMPFYTFSARNIPLQIMMLLKRPGKFAQYAKAREEFAKAFGFEEGWEQRTSEQDQRAAGFPVKWKGVEFTLSLGPSGLPLTDLNEMPVSANPADTAAEWMSRAASMVTPIIKSPVEMWANFSFFFRDQLERDTSPLVPAPAWAQHLPNPIKKMTGLVPDFYDRRTGKYTWGWRAKADYIVNQVPGPAAFANRLSKSSTRQGQSDALDTLAYFGPRVRPIDSMAATVNNLYDERDEIHRQQAILRQRNIKTGRVPVKERDRFLELKKRERVVGVLIKQLQVRMEAQPEPTDGVDGKSLQQEVLKRMTAPARPTSNSELEDEIRRRLGG